MKISGLQKLSLVDFDGHISATIFTAGCNFLCPFCHNSGLVYNLEENIEVSDVIEYLNKRKNMLDSVCISGGERTLNKDLPQCMSNIKNLGYKVKLDTNGTNLEMIQYLVENKLVDYIAMDIKNSIDKYQITTNCPVDTNKIRSTIKYIMNSNIDYEFRTTLVQEYHDLEDIKKIGKLIHKANKYFLQHFVDNGNCIGDNLHAVNKETAEIYLKEIKKYVPNSNLRGY